MSRSLSVHPRYIEQVKLTWKHKSNGREQFVAKELGLSLPVVHLFLKGQLINGLNFLEICQTLGLNWREMAGLDLPESPASSSPVEKDSGNTISNPNSVEAVSIVDEAIKDLVSVLCEMLCRLTRKAGDLLSADRTSIFLLDRQRNKLGSINAEDGEGGSLVIEIPVDRGIASLAATSADVINIPFDVYDDPRSEEAKKTDYKTGYRTYTILAWPLLNKQQDLVAVVQFINKLKPNQDPEYDLCMRIDTNGFTQEDEEQFATFAPSIQQILERCQFCYQLTQRLKEKVKLNQADVALHNTQLITELRKQEQQLRKIIARM
jgi:hypothetical protein